MWDSGLFQGNDPVGGCVACMKMTFKHFRGRTEGLIINQAESLLHRTRGWVCLGVGEGAMCVKTFVKDTERLQREKKRKQNSSQSPRLPALSDSFASL